MYSAIVLHLFRLLFRFDYGENVAAAIWINLKSFTIKRLQEFEFPEKVSYKVAFI